MGDRRFRVAQTSFSDHPFSAETLLCVWVNFRSAALALKDKYAFAFFEKIALAF